jgi:hypothetical protein
MANPIFPIVVANPEDGVEAHVNASVRGGFNVTMRDIDSGEWVPHGRCGMSLDVAIALAKKWAGVDK